MGFYRMYTGEDGHTRIEGLDLVGHPELGSLRPVKGVVFRESPPGNFSDWHPAPRRQFVISLAGELEIGLGDGSLHRFGPGDVRLVEDTTGYGHTTRVVSNGPSVTAVTPLED